MLSSLRGKAMTVEMEDIPNKGQIRDAVPAHCFKKDTLRSLGYAFRSCALSAACLAVGTLIPLKTSALPLWAAYAAVTGTVATGMWVIAHECGHNAFSDNILIQDTVGYILHSMLLVPYFSWQRSHAVHHSRTNHISEGETHVPLVINGRKGIENTGGEKDLAASRKIGKNLFAALQLFFHLVLGWPMYLMFGATGGPVRGMTNHFIPSKPFSNSLWPNAWPKKVWLSDIGIVAMLGGLGYWASKAGLAAVGALYFGPLAVVNMWLVLITWLQHTEVDVPHLPKEDWSYMRGAFLTIDRNYPKIIDWLHHEIGTTHVAHHIDCTIPHYHAREATDAIAKAFPKPYLYESTPIWKAAWRVAKNCVATIKRPEDNRYVFVQP